ncbi:DUF6176 family protein [Arthrobacter mobilis]|uniref:Uncharacterized protein n=1 Tax=Arthrobacter mobilis TaxID=2724944 RepID=A0A7X6QM28_9MICC|nr:DUF6176 family protein [Arthrobacter mobilis]NKX56356.1 hypothetical protein [Arthrobacter mobilis]
MESITWFAPILPGKVEAWKEFVEELKGPRKEEYEASFQRNGMNREVASLMQTPQGDFTCFFQEAESIAKVAENFATSQEPYDVWFREKVNELHGITPEMLQGSLPATVYLDHRRA